MTDRELVAAKLRTMLSDSGTPPTAVASIGKVLVELEEAPAAPLPEAQVVTNIHPERLSPQDASMLQDVLLPELARMSKVAGSTDPNAGLDKLTSDELSVLEYMIQKADGPGSLRAPGPMPVFEPEERAEFDGHMAELARLLLNADPYRREARGLPPDRPASRGLNVVDLQPKGGAK